MSPLCSCCCSSMLQPTKCNAGQSRQTEAQGLLQQSFEVRSSSPSTFAFLCDQLAALAQAGDLQPSLTAWLSDAATEEVEAFLADRTATVSHIQVSSSCHSIALLATKQIVNLYALSRQQQLSWGFCVQSDTWLHW